MNSLKKKNLDKLVQLPDQAQHEVHQYLEYIAWKYHKQVDVAMPTEQKEQRKEVKEETENKAWSGFKNRLFK